MKIFSKLRRRNKKDQSGKLNFWESWNAKGLLTEIRNHYSRFAMGGKKVDRTRLFRQEEEMQFKREMNGRTDNMRVRPGINDVKIGYNS